MSSRFLDSLTSILEDQFSAGENNNKTLDKISEATQTNVRYGALGEFASKFDQSQERRYLEQGYLRRDSFNATPRQLEVTFQQPTATVLIKKRAFSSLAENFGEENLDKEEKTFIKATRTLFHNKATQIAAFEQLFKAQQILEKDSSYSDQLMPLIISMVDRIAEGNSLSVDTVDSEPSDTKTASISGFNRLKSVTDKIKTLYAFSSQNKYTTWITNQANPFRAALGQGTGVIELTNVKGFDCTNTLTLDGGNCTINFSDPYNLMTITSYDIERAISDATNRAYNSSTFEFGRENIKLAINDLKTQLNNRRAARGVSRIDFITNPNTVLGKRVRAIIEGPGIEIPFEYNPFAFDDIDKIQMTTVNKDYLIGGAIAGNEGLNDVKKNLRTIISGYEGVSSDPTSNKRSQAEPGVSYKTALESSELTLFADIVDNIFTMMTLEANTRENIKKSNQETNYIRKKLRLHYLGKSIVQPMDQVHLYISSKSKEDKKIVGGMRSSMRGLDFKQKMNGIFADLKTITGMFKPSVDLYAQVEKSAFVGENFPNALWAMFRDGFINDNDGTHVFGGVIKYASSSYGSSGYSVTCSCGSMTEYFSQGRFNWKPSTNVFNGELLDPLTIWKSRIDSVSYDFKNDPKDLLDENKKLIQSGTARFKSGNNIGQTVTATNLISDEEIAASGQRQKIIYEPDGLVHRWKEGIGTLTAHSMSAKGSAAKQFNFYEEPFAGQDIMNIISILVTGIPYNFVTYYSSAIRVGTERVDEKGIRLNIQSQMAQLRNGVAKNNIIWGNFIPFKNLIVPDDQVILTINAQNDITKKSSEISDLLSDKAKIINTINLLNQKSQNSSEVNKLKDKLKEIDTKLDGLKNNKFTKQLNNLIIIGDNVSYDSDSVGLYGDTNKNKVDITESSVKSLKRKIRRKINFLTRRFARDVRANQDKNLFIVDDSYDKDNDIWTFNAKLTKMSLYNSEFSTVRDKIDKLSTFLDLEIFCDTQGNIRARSPQYNKIPSSVFFRLLKMKNEYGIELFPKFLTDLVKDQLSLAIDNMAVIEDKIRLYCAALGYFTDQDIEKLMRGSGISAKSASSFSFISDKNGNIQNKNILDADDGNLVTKQKDFANTLDGQLKISGIFNLINNKFVAQISSKALGNVGNQYASVKEVYNSDYVQAIILRINQSSVERITENDFISATSSSGYFDFYKIYKLISSNLLERQNLIKKTSALIKNSIEMKSIENDSSVQNALLAPDAFDYTNIPDIFENLIEDESFDEFGPGSGSRFVIKDSQIKSLTIKEDPPNFTSVVVIGSPDVNLSEVTQGLNAEILPGVPANFQNSAAAVDYDMWRMYGFKTTQAFKAPFLKDPDTQCAPMAVSLLNKARSEIFSGTAEIVGNEYMQPGDVVYIESKDTLFYVKSVQHTFNYASKSFTTNLHLNYGRPPGEYIPTKMDMIGKILYRNRESGSYVLHRDTNSYNEKHIGAIFVDDKNLSSYTKEINASLTATQSTDDTNKLHDDIDGAILDGKYSEINSNAINRLFEEISLASLQNDDENTNVKVKLMFRTYAKSENTDKAKPRNILSLACGRIQDMLTGKASTLDKFSKKLKVGNKAAKSTTVSVLDPNNTEKHIEAVSIRDPKETRSPSSFCRDLASKALEEHSSRGSQEDIITNNIIDLLIAVEYEPKN